MNILSIGRSTVYQLLRSGQLPSIRVGKQYRISKKFFSENPILVTAIKPQRPSEYKQRAYIGIDELETFFQAISRHRLETPFTLTLYYGLRREEILGLRWSSVRNGKIYIEHTISRVMTTTAKKIAD